MTLTGADIFESLLRSNYFPAQRKRKEELPPVFTTNSFTASIGELLCAEPIRKANTGYPGYDHVEYCATRFNNVPRIYGIPHPAGYVHLAKCISTNWNNLNYIASSSVSKIKPRLHADGRIIIMDYDNATRRAKNTLNLGFGAKYRVSVDIANFFPSIYTHAISWATVGLQVAKATTSSPQSGQKSWFDKLDACQRMIKRNESQGIAIGPASSNIVSEAILSRIDSALKLEFGKTNHAYRLERYIDDYSFYCESEDEALRFIRRLNEELSKYKLTLNPKKTKIESSYLPLNEEWLIKASLLLPSKVNSINAYNYLDAITELASHNPNSSVLKYGATALVSRIKNSHINVVRQVLDYLTTHCIRHPVLLPILVPLFDRFQPLGLPIAFPERILRILEENILLHRSDGMAWSLYLCMKYKIPLGSKLPSKIIDTRDCIAICMLSLFAQHNKKCIKFVSNQIDHNNLHQLDQYWLLIYELYRTGKIVNPYQNDHTFDILRAGNVSFLNK